MEAQTVIARSLWECRGVYAAVAQSDTQSTAITLHTILELSEHLILFRTRGLLFSTTRCVLLAIAVDGWTVELLLQRLIH